jgi:hypothetical protein
MPETPEARLRMAAYCQTNNVPMPVHVRCSGNDEEYARKRVENMLRRRDTFTGAQGLKMDDAMLELMFRDAPYWRARANEAVPAFSAPKDVNNPQPHFNHDLAASLLSRPSSVW